MMISGEGDVVKGIAPFLVELDLLDTFMMIDDIVHDAFKCHSIRCKTSFIRNN